MGVQVLDCVHKTPKAVVDGYPYIAIPNVVDGRLDLSTVRGISDDDLREWTKRYKPKAGDVLVTRRGRVGDTARIPEGLECAIGQNLVLLRPDQGTVDPNYLYWVTRGADWRDEVSRLLNVGAVFDSLNVRDLPRMRLPFPPVGEQKRIAEVLGAVDELIALNNGLARSSFLLAQALYARAIREGSSAAALSDLVVFENRNRVPLTADERRAMPGPYPYYGAAGPIASVGKYIFDGVRLLVGEDGTVVNRTNGPVLQQAWGKYWVNNHAHVLRGVDVSTEFVRVALSQVNIAPFVTGAVQPKLNMGNLKRVPLEVPDDPRAADLITLLASVERGAVDESRRLQAVRDEVIPLLLTGRLRPSDVAA